MLLGLGRLRRRVIRNIALLRSPVPRVGAGGLSLIAILPIRLSGVRGLRTLPLVRTGILTRRPVSGGCVGGILLGLIRFLFCILIQRIVGVVCIGVVVFIRVIHKPLLLSKRWT